jgi:glucokinase
VILAGDVGGTNVRLALFDVAEGRLVLHEQEKFRSRELDGLEQAVRRFMKPRGKVTAAGFGVAGPVRDGRCEATNLPWIVDSRELARELGLARTALVNDLAANALGIPELSAKDVAVLNAGVEDPDGNGALISAGTGLGEAILVRNGAGFTPLPSEGGHSSFAPRDAHEIKLLRFLMSRYGHVSFERVLSGPGLANVYAFERAESGVPEPAWMSAEIAAAGDVAPVVTAAALSERDEVAETALTRFVKIYGGEAGNLALKALATGGVYVGGGIAPRILPVMHEAFFPAFCDKGRFAQVLSRIPIKVILNDACALLGAARAAADAAS